MRQKFLSEEDLVCGLELAFEKWWESVLDFEFCDVRSGEDEWLSVLGLFTGFPGLCFVYTVDGIIDAF